MPSSASSNSGPRQQTDYIFRPEDPEHLHEQQQAHEAHQRLVSQGIHNTTSSLSQRQQQLVMDEREQKSLVRVQILSPLAVLLNIGAMVICGSGLVKPTLTMVSKRHKTYLTVQESFIMVYWAVLYLLLMGFSVFIMISRTPATKKTIVHGVGTRLALCNYLMVLWAIFWVLDRKFTFILGTAALSVVALLLLFNALVLAIKYRPSKKHPLDWLFIHVPIKMFLVVMVQYDIWQQLFMALGWEAPIDHEQGLWPAFGIITGVGVLSALWIFATCDFTWTVSGIYLSVGLLSYKYMPIVGENARPAALTAAIILSISLQTVALFASVAWSRIKARQEGRIALPMTPEQEAAAIRAETERQAAHQVRVRDEEEALSPQPVPGAVTVAEGEAEASAAQANKVKVTRKLGSSSSSSGGTGTGNGTSST